MQETLYRFLTRRPADLENAEAWLIAVATRVCMEQRRRLARESAGTGMAGAEVIPQHSRDAADIALARAWTHDLLRRLRPLDRRVLSMLYLEDRSAGEVAELQSTSPGNVRILALRARRRAREVLESLGQSTAAVLGLPAVAWHRLSSGVTRRLAQLHARRGGAGGQLGVISVGAPLLVPVLVASIAGGIHGVAPAAAVRGDAAVAATSGVQPHRADDTGLTGRAAQLDVGAPAERSRTSGADGAAPDRSPAGVVGSLLQPGNSAQQQDVGFVSVTPSPDYAHDQTIFASGNVVSGCTWNCLVLFRSTDAGRTWTNMRAAQYQGLRVVLPATYPSDPTVYAVGAAGLQRSNDGGASFSTVVPGATAAAAVPASVSADTELALGTVPLLLYHERGAMVSAGPTLPVGVDEVDDIAVTPTGSMLVTAMQRSLSAPGSAPVLLECPSMQGSCSVVTTFDAVSPFHIATGSDDPSTVVVYGPSQIELSSDGGRTFTAGVRPGGLLTSVVTAPGFAQTRTLFAVTSRSVGGSFGTDLLRSSDAAGHYVPLPTPDTAQGSSIAGVEVLPDGHILVALSVADAKGFGLRCSIDSGRTWSLGC